MKYYLLALLCALAPSVSTAAAYSAVTTCGTVEAAKVTGADGLTTFTCETFTGNDTPFFNDGNSLFGHNDWQLLAQDSNANGIGVIDDVNNTLLGVVGNGSSGSWQINATGYGEYLLLFKPGQTSFAYLVTELSGLYEKMTQNNLSHISLYARGTAPIETPAVPLPAGLPLALSGVAGLGLLGVRKRFC